MKKYLFFMFSFLLLFTFTTNVNALTFPKTIDKFVANNNVNINKNIDGDLYFAGNNITVNSNVNGDIIGAGNTINITGNVTSNIRIAGNNLNFNNLNAKNLTIAGANILFMNINVNRVYAAAANIEFNGVANNVNFAGEEVIINGTINGISNIEAEKVTIKSNAIINGKLNVKATEKIAYEGNVIKDNIIYTKVKYNKNNEFNLNDIISSLTYKILSMSLIALVIMLLFNNFIEKSIKNIKEKKVSTILFGLLLFITIPIIALLTLITVIGIPIVIIAIFAYITTIMIASTFTAIALGNILFKDMNKYLSVLLAILIISILSLIPIVNFFVWLIGIGYTFGSMALLFKKNNE